MYRKLLAVPVALLAFLALVLFTAPAAQATSGWQCANIYAWDPPQVCIDIVGTGTYVDTISAHVDSGYASGSFKLWGPSGFTTRYSSTINVEGGKNIYWNFYRYLPKGSYCIAFHDNYSGRWDGNACAGVHP